MLVLEPLAALIVVGYVGFQLSRNANKQAFLRAFALLAAAGAAAENSVIAGYGFYHYSADWSLWVGHVPLLVILIWPVVILSAGDLARFLLPPGSASVPFVGAAIVFADAWLIEPVAVHAGLWAWSEPGVFAVPPIGVLGWSLFAFGALMALERRTFALLIPFAVCWTHATLWLAWWALFRWCNSPIEAVWGLLVAWGVAMAICIAVAWKGAREVPLWAVLARAPGAAFFFVLLATTSAPKALVAYACAFAMPYFALMVRGAARFPR